MSAVWSLSVVCSLCVNSVSGVVIVCGDLCVLTVSAVWSLCVMLCVC